MAFPDRRLGVYCCGHVFRRERGVRLVSHEDGDWQFLCGDVDHVDPDEPYHVSVGVLLERDPTIDTVSDLESDWAAERTDVHARWIRTPCAPQA
ncbi:hypothetical protein H8R02_14370 [Ramlibacter sp. GTP1]|uniref:DUF2185 domain-containing protein n=2 Tax=Ramlibacter albus TaxID=2079448 RepID=A0A923S2N1_9BURK|nr:hypothetical protein [Ramlibacter albus]